MASFRTGFKIFRDISLKQGLGRIRSFSEDRKPGQWLPEDQWAVRQPGSTCPEPCDKPRKPPKSSKSWLSICKEPEKENQDCDARHNNCPPPETKDTPWYSLDNLIPKKKPQENPPPLSRCREEMRRRQMLEDEDEVCDNMGDTTSFQQTKPQSSECSMPKEPCPAPVVNIMTPLPKELDISLWCERPSRDTSRIPIICQNDKLPYSEFRPKKTWKPPPFSLPIRGDLSKKSPLCSAECMIFAEFKQVEVPKPLYTRYKTVELSEKNSLLCMANVKCPDDESVTCEALKTPSPPPIPCKSAFRRDESDDSEELPKLECPEKPLLEAASCKPVRIKRATVCKFRPKPTKLIERRVYKRPCAKNKTSDSCRPQKEESQEDCGGQSQSKKETPKVITGTLTDEPQVLERAFDKIPTTPPSWMYQMCKPGCQQTPLVPCGGEVTQEPDWCAETDGLKFYDGKDENICPKPSPDPWVALDQKEPEKPLQEPVIAEEDQPEPRVYRNRFVLMPDQYNIKRLREESPDADVSEEPNFEKFVQTQTSTKSFPQIKENILYDLQRLCPNPPLDPSVFNSPCRKPAEPECPQPTKFYRSFSTLSPSQEKLWPPRLCKVPSRTECDDPTGKCKPRKLIPKAKECPKTPPKFPSCSELRLPCCPKAKAPPTCHMKEVKPLCKKIPPPQPSFSECSRDLPPCPKMTECDCWDKIPRNSHISRHSTFCTKAKLASKVKCLTLQPSSAPAGKSKMILGLKDPKGFVGSEYEPRPQVESLQKKTQARNGPGLMRTQPKVNASPPRSSSLILREAVPKAKTAPLDETHFKGKEPVLTIEQEERLKYKPCNLPVAEKDLREKVNAIPALKDEDAVALYDSPENNEENSRAFMESIGSWINDLFSVPNKRSLSPKDNKEVHKELVSQEDAEYLKSISTIKEQFRKKLKSETTVHISSPETPFELNFDKVLDTTKKLKRKQKAQPLTNTSDWLDELNDDLNAENEYMPRQHHTSGHPSALVIRSGETETQLKALKQKNLLHLTPVDMPKERKKTKTKQQNRRNFKDLEEYNLPKAGELSKKILLNMSEQEKFSQFYKNAHLGAQDYGQRKAKGYQTNTRCYTTKAKGRGKVSAGALPSTNRNSHYSSAAAPAKSFAEFLAKNPVDFRKSAYRNSSRKAISEMSRDTMTFAKIKTPTPFPTIHESKAELRTNSDELVKNLIKKIKNGRQQLAKKKGRTRVPQVVGAVKNRFMQSATNSLVMTAIAKKEENSLTSKSSPRLFGENRIPPTKELVLKQSENAMRLDFAKPPMSSSGSGGKFSKTAYQVDEGISYDDYANERGNRRFLRPTYDEILNREANKNEKYYKRQEVKRMLSNLEMKGIFPFPRTQSKKEQQHQQQKKQGEEENVPATAAGEPQNPRFQKEHELFKKIIKTQMEQLEEAAEAETEDSARESAKESTKEVQKMETTVEPTPAASELTVIEKNTPEQTEQIEKKKSTEPQSEVIEQKSIIVTTCSGSNKSNNETIKSNITEFSKNNSEISKGNAEFSKSSSEFGKSHNEVSKGHNEVSKGHHEGSKSHNEFSKSHNEFSKGHSEFSKSHNEFSKGHSEFSKSHNEFSKGHSEFSKSHNEFSKGHNELSKSHNEFSKGHNDSSKKDMETLSKKPHSGKTDKKASEKVLHAKERVPKSKTSKDPEPKSLTNPLVELCGTEIQYQRDMPKPFEVQIPPKELSSKSPESLLINRRYSTNSMNEGTQGSKFLPWNYMSPSLYLLENEKEKKEKPKRDGCKDTSKDKEPAKAPKSTGSYCGFDREKQKPGPDCSKD